MPADQSEVKKGLALTKAQIEIEKKRLSDNIRAAYATDDLVAQAKALSEGSEFVALCKAAQKTSDTKPVVEFKLDDIDLDEIVLEAEAIQTAEISSDVIKELDRDLERQEAYQAQQAAEITLVPPTFNAQGKHIVAFKERQAKPKPKTARKSLLDDDQKEIARYRKEEGNTSYNEFRKLKRWAKADEEGRIIVPRKNLQDMTPEEKAAHKREQALVRQRNFRAKAKII